MATVVALCGCSIEPLDDTGEMLLTVHRASCPHFERPVIATRDGVRPVLHFAPDPLDPRRVLVVSGDLRWSRTVRRRRAPASRHAPTS